MKDEIIVGTPRKRPIPGIEWEITTRCNYRCSYCSQRQYSTLLWKDCTDETISSVYKLLLECKGSWLVKLAGGEPLIHPRFFEICEWIAKTPHKVCTTTNFSASPEKLQKFIDIAGDSLAYIVASFHPEQVKDIDSFVEKAKYFQSAKRPETDFTVTSVGVEDNLDVLKYIADRFSDAGIRFEVAPYKENGNYIASENEEFNEFAGRWELTSVKKIQKLSSIGTICHTGRLFCRITAEGDVLRCYNLQPGMYMGNIKDKSFNWYESAKPCLAVKCTCTVPANRNLIEFGNRISGMSVIKEYNSALIQNAPGIVQLGGKWVRRSLINLLDKKDKN